MKATTKLRGKRRSRLPRGRNDCLQSSKTIRYNFFSFINQLVFNVRVQYTKCTCTERSSQRRMRAELGGQIRTSYWRGGGSGKTLGRRLGEEREPLLPTKLNHRHSSSACKSVYTRSLGKPRGSIRYRVTTEVAQRGVDAGVCWHVTRLTLRA